MEQADFHRHIGDENILPNVQAALRRAEEIWRAIESSRREQARGA
jgi:hypothetical protein